MAPKLYINMASPAVRSVLLLSKAIELELELEHIDLATGENVTPHFIRMNPQHTVPTIEDGDFIIWDSHAINAYLINKYSSGSSLYPTDPEGRAVVDQRMHFDSGVLYPKMAAVLEPIMKDGAKMVSRERGHALTAAYTILETLLENSPFVAGDTLTIADFSIVTTITSSNVLVPVAENRFPNIAKWLEKMRNLPYYEEGNQIGLEKFTSQVKSKLA